MTKRGAGIILSLITILQFQLVFAQQPDSLNAPPEDWFLRDPQSDSLQGVSAEKTYATILHEKPSKTVLVAVIDSGIDIEHEDLKDVIWTNEGEISGNGIDDDKNGFIDDIHGWNFIGGKNGNVVEDTYEVTREYARLKPIYETADEKKIGKKQKAEYEYWKTVKAKYERDSKYNTEQYEMYKKHYENYINIHRTLDFCDSVLEIAVGHPISKSMLSAIEPKNDTIKFAKQTLIDLTASAEGDFAIKDAIQEVDNVLDQLKEAVDHFKTAYQYGYNTEFNSRTVIGDDPLNLNEKGYGNNDVEGPDARHGTHVAGIIGASRKNTIGIQGIADNVRIMSVRAVPNGDERDKDVANAIIYAVDNGAKVINMSFGKSFSPQKEYVDKAVRYAASKNVLLIHAAGNDGDDLDSKNNYPNKIFTKGGSANNWLEIGASSFGSDQDFVGSFSNYGKKSVDLFAPGVQMYSTTPNNTYESLQGTSMACPATTGVAAILLSYFPDLSATQIKDILRQSTRKFDKLKVIKPGTKDDKVNFSDLSSTGGLVNAYEAVRLAMTMQGNKAK